MQQTSVRRWAWAVLRASPRVTAQRNVGDAGAAHAHDHAHRVSRTQRVRPRWVNASVGLPHLTFRPTLRASLPRRAADTLGCHSVPRFPCATACTLSKGVPTWTVYCPHRRSVPSAYFAPPAYATTCQCGLLCGFSTTRSSKQRVITLPWVAGRAGRGQRKRLPVGYALLGWRVLRQSIVENLQYNRRVDLRLARKKS